VRNSPDIVRWLGRHKGWIQHATLIGSTAALSDNAAAELRNLLRTTVTQYAYNPLDELTSEIVLGADTTLYTYDPMGNRASATHNGVATAYTYDLADRLAAAGTVTYAYDGNGNRISRVEGSATSSYAFDYENRLTQISGPEGVSKYAYDGLGRRIRSEEPGRIRRYALDPTSRPYRTLRETNDAGTTQVSYVHADGLTSDISPTGATRYFHFDGLGSTAAITDSVGNDVGHLAYVAFGDTALRLGNPATVFGYVGRFGVEATASGLQFMRDRFYDSAIGQFISGDPDPPPPQAYLQSLFPYANSNPLVNIDPSGRKFSDSKWLPWNWFKKPSPTSRFSADVYNQYLAKLDHPGREAVLSTVRRLSLSQVPLADMTFTLVNARDVLKKATMDQLIAATDNRLAIMAGDNQGPPRTLDVLQSIGAYDPSRGLIDENALKNYVKAVSAEWKARGYNKMPI
jgi:RHS repeat-associated protein